MNDGEANDQRELLRQLAALQRQVEENGETLRAIRAGEVDAFVIGERDRERVYLLKSAEVVTEILEQAVDGIVVCDREGHVMRASPATREICGADPLCARFEAVLPLTVLERGERVPLRIDPVLRGETLRGIEATLNTASGERHFIVAAGPLLDARRQIVGCVVTMADVTERMRIEQALREADRRKDEFLAVLSHELRNPLAAATNAVRVLQGGALHDGERRGDIIAVLERQMTYLARLVDDLLDVARLNTGKIVLRLGVIDMKTVVERCVEALRALGRLSGRSVTADFDGALVHGDAMRLEQMVLNLLENAVKYSEDGDRIALELRCEGEECVFRVRDSGRGIAPETLPRVFDFFVQEAPQDSARGGLGIGLALVRHLVGLHGGNIEAHSEGPGRGSEFVLRLPLARVDAQAPQAPIASRDERRRIVLVEDYPDARLALQQLLEMRGHDVVCAPDGRRGLELVLSWRPDVALVDIDLPDMNGYELAAKIRASKVHPMLIAVSGFGREQDRKQALDAGFDDHLTKPIDLERLARLLAGIGARR